MGDLDMTFVHQTGVFVGAKVAGNTYKVKKKYKDIE